MFDLSVHRILSLSLWGSLRSVQISLNVLLGWQWLLLCRSPMDAIYTQYLLNKRAIKSRFYWDEKGRQLLGCFFATSVTSSKSFHHSGVILECWPLMERFMIVFSISRKYVSLWIRWVPDWDISITFFLNSPSFWLWQCASGETIKPTSYFWKWSIGGLIGKGW